MSPIVITVLISLASYRIWHFLAVDTFAPIRRPRDWLLAKTQPKAEWVGDLIECAFCAGSWITGLVTWVVATQISVPLPVLVGLAAATIVPLIAQYDES